MVNEAFREVYLYFENTRKNFRSNLVLVVVLVLESKGPYYLFVTSLVKPKILLSVIRRHFTAKNR